MTHIVTTIDQMVMLFNKEFHDRYMTKQNGVVQKTATAFVTRYKNIDIKR